ncbi:MULTISPECIES: ParA family protein [Methylobacterium]|uniref:Protein virC1 n=1 Tax=Methylobacterium isbiliense TaxID=315478 RepID=A0ABQ4SKC0_9HYPH|nr:MULTISPECIES: ParA family protein [Methylobacterium]MBY0296862.1 ParA family protein [Methylobacterium sp.]MDN3626768.1 ParA family protein [Methylobacterium isbiliense]GJE02193.1 Protein virC1 [Methylobacterium isbiliense]
MAIMATASAKGGVGKTTLSILIAADLALDGYKVALLDCDLNQHASAFGTKADIPNLTVIPAVVEQNVLSAMRQAEEGADMVIVDLPGGSSTLALKALQRSNFVIVPCQASLPDVKDAVKTMEQIADAEDLSRVKIARSLIWTRVLPGYESRSAKHVRESIEQTGLPVFTTQQRELSAFREMHVTGRVPRQMDEKSAASANVAAITAELLGKLERMAEAA